ncbi:unnamed protein product [Hyaloperonospora brassicae]|uniref:Anaphase-promoting complex subunit 4 WD40 domain-containing protein n=1 Tax=Hyaloperonospora brassicae TaxID=162125 RepID=A0AAV0V5X5_HYABA|nr:unnamed protein product [Hyaloperonospora brassicae]
MKRRASPPISAFFQRKQTRRISVESLSSESDRDGSTSSTVQLTDTDDSAHRMTDPVPQPLHPTSVIDRRAPSRRSAREDVMGILQYRELDGGVAMRPEVCSVQRSRRRRKQLLVRWALTHFQRLPVSLRLGPHWERQAGNLSSETFYVSCLEFDSQGVLLVAGASNGVIALYDFDDAFHRTLNVALELQIHTIFTPFEVKSIRWNSFNEDEIACSFTNRNEIHVFNLDKFPSEPYKVLKSSNHPSSGYNDLLFLPAYGMTRRPTVACIIAGDVDGAIRMWDPRVPLRPVWSFHTGSPVTPINSLLLSENKQFLICGNEAGVLMTYDIQHKIVPAFGSKPIPQRKAAVNVMEAIKPYLSPALIDAVLLTSRCGSSGIMALHLMPNSKTQVLCQMRNDWVIVIDYLLGSVIKLHTFLRGVTPRDILKGDAPPSVLSAALRNDDQGNFQPRTLRNSWLSCHRCKGAFLFDKSIMCTGIHDTTSLNMIDLHHLRRNKSDANGDAAAKIGANTEVPIAERLDRFRIPMSSVITAVAAHPNQHSVICGGENMTLQIMSVVGN